MEQAILVLDDEPSSVELLDVTLGRHHKVYTATDGHSALQILAEHPEIALAIIDQRMPKMSGTEFIQATILPYPDLVRVILTGYMDIESLIAAINAGRVYRYLTKPWNKDELLGVVRQGLEVHRLQKELEEANKRLRFDNAVLKREAKGRYNFEGIVGASPAIQRTLETISPVVGTDVRVLILGETGTGKELVARAIHYNGPRADKPFLAVNCGAFTPELLASELFGHKKGAFSGAIEDRAGLFKTADGGTLFLDEVGDLALELQARLLRVLMDGEVYRLGDDTPFTVDVRIIAATNKNLELATKAGKFREDLFYRLSVFAIEMPPLRERREDIALLANHFIQRLAAKQRKLVHGLTSEALGSLAAHDFPGNVRELENEIERAFTLAEPDEYITQDLLSPKVKRVGPEPIQGRFSEQMARFEAQLIRDALARNKDHRENAAKDLGISRESIFAKIKKYGIKRLPRSRERL